MKAEVKLVTDAIERIPTFYVDSMGFGTNRFIVRLTFLEHRYNLAGQLQQLERFDAVMDIKAAKTFSRFLAKQVEKLIEPQPAERERPAQEGPGK